MKKMKKIFFILGLLLILPLMAFAGDISQIVFTNDPRAAKPDEVVQLTVQVQYAGDSHPTVCMQMFTDSGTGQFSSSDTNWNSVSQLTINSNWTNKNFYYKDSTEGNYILTVKVMPVSCSALTDEEAQWTISQNITISNESTEPPSDEPETTPTTGDSDSGWPEYVPPEDRPKITAYAGKDKVMIVGALGEFRGEGYDFDGELIEEKARYLWSLGDGTLKEGQNISHFYRYPGEYIVTLDVSSGKNSASDRLVVKVIPNEIIISEVKTGASSFVELYNGTKEEINISGWQIRSGLPAQTGRQTFNLPKNTFIKPLGYSVFPVFLSEMVIPQGGGEVELLYSTGYLADSFSYSGFLSEDQSFSCAVSDTQQKNIYIDEETPGAKNIEPVVLEKVIHSTVTEYTPPVVLQEEEKDLEEAGNTPTSAEVNVEEIQQANVISIVGAGSEVDKTKLYLFLVLGLVFFAGLGVFLVRRERSV